MSSDDQHKPRAAKTSIDGDCVDGAEQGRTLRDAESGKIVTNFDNNRDSHRFF